MANYNNDDDFSPELDNRAAPPVAGKSKDVVREFTDGQFGMKDAATGVKLVSGFIPGGTLLDLGATAAAADVESHDARQMWEQWAQRLGCSVDFLMANSGSLRSLCKEETEDNVGNTLSDWTATTAGGFVGAALGYVVPIPGASLVLGFAGSQIGGRLGATERVHSQVNVRDVANEIERKQYYGEEVTADEAFLLALTPQDRIAIYQEMKTHIPEGTDPVTAKHIFERIALDNSWRIKDKVESLGIDIEPGEFPSVALANAMNQVNPMTGKTLHPVLVLLDNPDNAPVFTGQQQNMVAGQQQNDGIPQQAGQTADSNVPVMQGNAGFNGDYAVPNGLPPKNSGPKKPGVRDLVRR